MAANKVIPVALPSGVEPTREDLDLLGATLQAIVGLHFEARHASTETARRLEAEGWEVRCRLGWIAEARRGNETERAFGDTRTQALDELRTVTDLDAVAGYSS